MTSSNGDCLSKEITTFRTTGISDVTIWLFVTQKQFEVLTKFQGRSRLWLQHVKQAQNNVLVQVSNGVKQGHRNRQVISGWPMVFLVRVVDFS